MKTLFDCYSRLLIDNHITDLKPEYMRKFDPAEYVEMVRLAGVEAAMVYASDHNGITALLTIVPVDREDKTASENEKP